MMGWIGLGLYAQAASVNVSPPNINARAYLLMEHSTPRVLLEKNANTPLEPASLTKMMTSYIVFDEIKNERLTLEDEVLISEKAWKIGGSRMFAEVNRSIAIDQLLKGLVIQSGNDAAIALAEHIGASEQGFADLMNQQADRLGMKNTYFVNATGWPQPKHRSTALDLAWLAKALIDDFPDLYPLHAMKHFTYNNIKQYNRNRLLWRDNTVDGIKTGHVQAAGYSLVASAKRRNMRLIAVVLGAPSESVRANAAASLLHYGFRFFEKQPLYPAGHELASRRIWRGKKQYIRLGLQNAVELVIPRGQRDNIQAQVKLLDTINAPVQAGQILGEATISLDEEVLTKQPLVALETVSEGSFLVKLIDSIRMMFH